jgi:RNA-directed DNA polymerase
MSLENEQNQKPSRYPNGEGCQGEPSNRATGFPHSGGVSGDDTVERTVRVSREISTREAARSQPAGQGGNAQTVRASGEVGALRSSCDPAESKTGGEPREGTRINAFGNSEGPGDGRAEAERLFERITTPPKVQKLQRALYGKAKAEPKYRFYSLYGELLRPDVLETAMRAVAGNNGAAGVDGQTCQVYLKSDEDWNQWRDQLLEELRTKNYRPSPVRRVYIPKGDGKMRPLGIPTVKDRVVQAAVTLLLLPLLEADSHPNSFAYRPKRRAHGAMDAIKKAMLQGRTEVIDADLSGYFDSIPHRKLLRVVSRRVSDGAILKLIRGWLRAPVVEKDPKTGTIHTQRNDRGTPQGGVISPVLANAYLNRLDWEVNERCAARPVMVRYADDFVILARPGQGAGLMKRLKSWLDRRGLTLNETKTRLVDIRREGIKFLGFALSWRPGRTSGRHYPHVEPHPKSLKKLRDTLREKLNRTTLWRTEEEVIPEINRQLKGWSGYFHYGNSTRVFGQVQQYVEQRVSRWLWRKHGCTRGLWTYTTPQNLYGTLRLYRLPTTAAYRHTR